MKTLKSYKTKSDKVFLLDEGAVKTVLHQCMGRSRMWNNHRYQYVDIEFAIDKFQEITDLIKDQASYKCNIDDCGRKCSAQNCPKKLGGTDYWKLFRDTCLYRSR